MRRVLGQDGREKHDHLPQQQKRGRRQTPVTHAPGQSGNEGNGHHEIEHGTAGFGGIACQDRSIQQRIVAEDVVSAPEEHAERAAGVLQQRAGGAAVADVGIQDRHLPGPANDQRRIRGQCNRQWGYGQAAAGNKPEDTAAGPQSFSPAGCDKVDRKAGQQQRCEANA